MTLSHGLDVRTAPEVLLADEPSPFHWTSLEEF